MPKSNFNAKETHINFSKLHHIDYKGNTRSNSILNTFNLRKDYSSINKPYLKMK